jgi:hypothetical protein
MITFLQGSPVKIKEMKLKQFNHLLKKGDGYFVQYKIKKNDAEKRCLKRK